METERKILRLGILMILCAVLLRAADNLGKEDIMTALVFMETGRWVTPEMMVTEAPTVPTLPKVREELDQPEEKPPVLTREDLLLVELRNDAGYAIDL